MTDKLDHKLVSDEINQTCIKKKIIPFRDSAIDKLQKQNVACCFVW